MALNSREHWENIYLTTKPDEVSWTQEVPVTSLEFIRQFNLPKSAKIIDIGGGDSKLVDHLLELGYDDITVLDISEKALDKVKVRLGQHALKVKWLTSDILDFKSETSYDLWHDRATFHFLTDPVEIKSYIDIARQFVNGFLTIGTFSDKGPEECSGLKIRQYSEESLQKELYNGFKKIKCITEDHITPFNTKQNFLFCSFKKVAS